MYTMPACCGDERRWICDGRRLDDGGWRRMSTTYTRQAARREARGDWTLCLKEEVGETERQREEGSHTISEGIVGARRRSRGWGALGDRDFDVKVNSTAWVVVSSVREVCTPEEQQSTIRYAISLEPPGYLKYEAEILCKSGDHSELRDYLFVPTDNND
ncbi:hypothetical protein Tco_1361901 [Tanacetum coccineum]